MGQKSGGKELYVRELKESYCKYHTFTHVSMALK